MFSVKSLAHFITKNNPFTLYSDSIDNFFDRHVLITLSRKANVNIVDLVPIFVMVRDTLAYFKKKETIDRLKLVGKVTMAPNGTNVFKLILSIETRHYSVSMSSESIPYKLFTKENLLDFFNEDAALAARFALTNAVVNNGYHLKTLSEQLAFTETIAYDGTVKILPIDFQEIYSYMLKILSKSTVFGRITITTVINQTPNCVFFQFVSTRGFFGLFKKLQYHSIDICYKPE